MITKKDAQVLRALGILPKPKYIRVTYLPFIDEVILLRPDASYQKAIKFGEDYAKKHYKTTCGISVLTAERHILYDDSGRYYDGTSWPR